MSKAASLGLNFLTIKQVNRCVEILEKERIDGFVMEIRGNQYHSDMPTFAKTINRVLRYLSMLDPACIGTPYRRCLIGEMKNIVHSNWHFKLSNEPISLTTFAPFYSSTNSRYQFCDTLGISNSDSSFLLFQPESAFHFYTPGHSLPLSEMNWDKPVTMRDKIRCHYYRHHRPYEIADGKDGALPNALTVIRPLTITDPYIRWWETD